MELGNHSLGELFEQLGLDPKHIESFVTSHTLGPSVRLADAPFWNDSQASFIRESLEQDADWSELIDQLDSMLR